MPLISVLLPLNFDKPLTYVADEPLPPGTLVEVPLAKKTVIGCVWDVPPGQIDAKKLKHAGRVLSIPPLSKALRDFVEWVARWTCASQGQVLKLVLREHEVLYEPRAQKLVRLKNVPAEKQSEPRQHVVDLLQDGFARTKAEIAREAGVSTGVIATLLKLGVVEEVLLEPSLPPRLDPQAHLPQLTKAQEDVAKIFREHVRQKKFTTSLLHGATGSGKTEVYFEAVAEAISQGQQALVLVPEIALTAQFLERFTKRFGSAPLEWHSQISPSKRARLWHQIISGEAQVVVGARSALFLPYKNIGLIVVDEEHESSYRQEDYVHYHARDMAVVRGKFENCAVVLSSATPSLESWANASAGRYEKFDLHERY
ncbi:MAG: primosomal protein N', partial [Pseudomonadota bacterium]